MKVPKESSMCFKNVPRRVALQSAKQLSREPSTDRDLWLVFHAGCQNQEVTTYGLSIVLSMA
jgi:hypothetical protein